MRKSKYLHKTFENWVCTHVGVARVQPKCYKVTRKACRSFVNKQYYYLFERLTSDCKAIKQIRLSAAQAAKVYKGLATVEMFAELKETSNDLTAVGRINYHNI